MGETPSSLAFYNEIENENAFRRELDLVEKRRNGAELRNAMYKQHNAKYYNQKVRKWALEIGSFVLRRAFSPPGKSDRDH